MIYNIILVLGIQHCDSVFYRLFSIKSYYEIVAIIPCGIQYILLLNCFIRVVCICYLPHICPSFFPSPLGSHVSLWFCLFVFPCLEVLFLKSILKPLSALIKLGLSTPDENQCCLDFLPKLVDPGKLPSLLGGTSTAASFGLCSQPAQLGVQPVLFIALGLCSFSLSAVIILPANDAFSSLPQSTLQELPEALIRTQAFLFSLSEHKN